MFGLSIVWLVDIRGCRYWYKVRGINIPNNIIRLRVQ